MIKKLLWIIWAPLILVGLVLASVGIVALIGIYSTEYKDDIYEVSTKEYSGLEKFNIPEDSYLVLTSNEIEPIVEKVNVYIELIYGHKFDVVNTKPSNYNYIEFVLDETLSCSYKYVSLDNENITIIADNKDHLLRGSYAFLEEFGGIKCYTSNLIKVNQDKIEYPSKINGYTQEYTDAFEMRDTDWISPKDDEYSWFRGYNTDEYRYEVKGQEVHWDSSLGKWVSQETLEEAKSRIDSENDYYSSLGGRTQYISSFCHTFASEFCSRDKYYYDNSPYLSCFALDNKGNRRSDELCLSNPETLRIVCEEVKALLEDGQDSSDPYRYSQYGSTEEEKKVVGTKYNPDAPLQIISLTQSDDLTACKCKDCVDQAKKNGGYSYVNIKFVNAVAQYVKDLAVETGRDYSNVAIDTFAYRYTRTAPLNIKPLDNVIIRICSIECCASHRIDDPKCLANKTFMKDLSDWSKLTDRIYMWDYSTNYSYFLTLFPNIKLLAHNIRIYKENSVLGIYQEGNYTIDKDSTDDLEFAELRAYVISKVMQDPYCDYEKEMLDFCKAYYGEVAGVDMYNFISKAETYSQRLHLNIYKNPAKCIKLSNKELKELNDLFEHAKANSTGEEHKRVLNSEVCFRYYKMYAKVLEFSDKDTYDNEVEKLYAYIEASSNNAREHEVDNYAVNNLLQTAIINLRPLFDLVVGNFIYGP